jgi:hypothetical protein
MSEIERASWTVDEFCDRHDISRTTYFQLKKDRRGPREMRLGGTIRISLEAERDWRLAREQLDAVDRASIERLRKRGRKAGRAAAESPRHYCRRKAGAK